MSRNSMTAVFHAKRECSDFFRIMLYAYYAVSSTSEKRE
jgi:hypothetical protein